MTDIVQRNLAVADEHIRNEARDPASVMNLYTDDIVLEVPGRGLLFDNKADIEANYRRMFGSLQDVEIMPVERFATEDRVVDDMIVRFRLVGEGMTHAPVPIGSLAEIRLLHVFHMQDGKIAREIVHEQWKRLD